MHAFHALSDDANSHGGMKLGYDFAAIEDMSRTVDNQIARQNFTALRAVVGDPLAESIWAYLKLRNI